jgi:hypothetical protein
LCAACTLRHGLLLRPGSDSAGRDLARRSLLRELGQARNSRCCTSTYLDSVDLRIIRGTNCELDGDGSARVRGHEEGLNRGNILSSRDSHYVEVLEDLIAVDRDVELALTGLGPKGLGKVKIHNVFCARRQAGEGVGEGAEAIGLIDSLWSGVGNQRGVDEVAA